MGWLRRNMWYFAGFGLAVMMLGVLGVTMYFGGVEDRSPVENPAPISGNVHVRGVVAEEGSQIMLVARLFGGETFVPVAEVMMSEEMSWEWDRAESGRTYEVRVELVQEGMSVAQSNTVSVTAPASAVRLVLGVTDTVDDEAEATISGVLELSGYVPLGSTVSVWQRLEGAEEFVQADDVSGNQGAEWNASGLEPGSVYEIKGQLDFDDRVVGQSRVLRVAAPASGEVLRVRSAAVPEADAVKSATVSGTIRLNGPVEEASTVLILQRQPGETDYSAIMRLPAVNGSEWSWPAAVAGRAYEMTAVLQVEGENSSVGSMQTVVAPAVNKTFVIDTNLSFRPPLARPQVTCQEQDDSGNWRAELEFVKIEGAKNYWLSVGSGLGTSDVVDERVPASGDDMQKLVVSVAEGEKTYARYAYGYCLNCLPTQNYSSFSPTLTFQCPRKVPTPVVQGYRCERVSRQCVETTESRAEYAHTSTGLELCRAGCE